MLPVDARYRIARFREERNLHPLPRQNINSCAPPRRSSSTTYPSLRNSMLFFIVSFLVYPRPTPSLPSSSCPSTKFFKVSPMSVFTHSSSSSSSSYPPSTGILVLQYPLNVSQAQKSHTVLSISSFYKSRKSLRFDADRSYPTGDKLIFHIGHVYYNKYIISMFNILSKTSYMVR